MVNVKFFGIIRLLIKISNIEVEANTVDEALMKISKEYDVELNNLYNSVILVNEKSITNLKRFKTKLMDGDEIKILSVGGGG